MSKSKNILFVNLPPVSPELSNTDDATSALHLLPPIGLLYLADSIKDKEYIKSYGCVDFALYDYGHLANKKDIQRFVHKQLLDGTTEKPDIIAVSLMFSSAYDFFQLIISEIKKCWEDSIIVVGGVHATNTVEYLLLNNSEIDYVVCGEGEEAFSELIKNIACENEANILGVHSKDNIKKTQDNHFEITKFVDNINIDFSKYSDLIDMDKYTHQSSLFSLSKTSIDVRSFAIMASRGCPGRCTFCVAHTVHGRKSRWRDIQNAIDEIYWLNSTYGVTKFYLMDDNFVPKRKAIELFDALSKINIENFEIVIQNLSITYTDYEIIDAIASAKISNIAFGIESGSKEVQKRIKKFLNLDKTIDLVRYSQSKGLNVRGFFIIGFPEESVDEMEQTFEYAKKVGADWSSFSVAVPLPGSEMYYDFVSLGYIEDGPISWKATTIRDRIFDCKEISAEEIKEMAYKANLSVNFINNPSILKKDYDNAERIFLNFIKSFDFHIFAHDCLRRIYKEKKDFQKEKEVVQKMKELLLSNNKAKSFVKYFDMFDDEGSFLEAEATF